MKRLENKVALITGGNSGIGYATAQEFIDQGARVIFTGRNAAAVEVAAHALGAQAHGLVSDAGVMDDLRRLPGQVQPLADKLDILFVNAGVAFFSPVSGADEAHFDQIMDINFKGAYFTVQQLLPLLREGASIIFNTSVNASVGMPNSGVYAASKAAVLALGRVLATELAPQGIRVNCISPGPVETPVYGKLGLPQEQLDGFAQVLGQKVLLKRFGQPSEIAKTAVFLASDEASFITGTEITVDGGLVVNAVLN